MQQHLQTLQDLFKRYRRPGDLVFASAFFVLSVVLLICLPYQTSWVERTKLAAQPAFWPAVSIGLMALFSGFHLLGALASVRIPGRMAEVTYWLRSLEFALWFLLYVTIVPLLGYLPATLALTAVLTLRLGYRGGRWIVVALLFGLAVVVIFKGILGVHVPGGALYRMLPEGDLRSFLLSYL